MVVRYRTTGVEALSATPPARGSGGGEQPGGAAGGGGKGPTGSLSRLEATWSNGPKANVIEK